MKRRDFLTLLLGGTAAARLSAASAQSPAMPVIGFLNSGSAAAFARLTEAFRQGLSDEGYIEGRNVTIEYRWAEGQHQRLEQQAAELAHRHVSLIAATGGVPSARAAKAATATIPILFISGVDPVRAKLVDSINRPSGNATGVTVITSEMVAKRLELLRELAPGATTIAMLVSPVPYAAEFEQKLTAELELKETAAAARVAGLKPLVIDATSETDLQSALNSAVVAGADAIFVSADPFFTDRREQIVAFAAHHRLPAIYPWRLFAEVGGLMSYGPNIAEMYKQIGRYAGRILKGAKPGDLPIQLPTRFELVLNLKTAKALGLNLSPLLLARLDEAIE
jgi:putative ABC transport system substrate-binding protein